MKEMTERQEEVYDLIVAYIDATGWPPTRLEIGQYFGFNRNAAQEHLMAIQKKGYISITKGIARGISVLDTSLMGDWTPVEDEIEVGDKVVDSHGVLHVCTGKYSKGINDGNC